MSRRFALIEVVACLACLFSLFLPACGGETADDPGDLYACEPICWKYSSEAVTDDADTLHFWQSMCEGGPSGCLAYECVAVTIAFGGYDAQRQAVQCESRKIGELAPVGDATAHYEHLGPDYGAVTSSGGTRHDAGIVTGWNNLSAYYYTEFSHPEWTSEMIEDVLVHEMSDVPCEAITDYRQCVRAFIPPRTHCVPVRVPPPGVTEADAPDLDYDWSLESIDCEPRYETNNRAEPDAIEMLYEFNPFEW